MGTRVPLTESSTSTVVARTPELEFPDTIKAPSGNATWLKAERSSSWVQMSTRAILSVSSWVVSSLAGALGGRVCAFTNTPSEMHPCWLPN